MHRRHCWQPQMGYYMRRARKSSANQIQITSESICNFIINKSDTWRGSAGGHCWAAMPASNASQPCSPMCGSPHQLPLAIPFRNRQRWEALGPSLRVYCPPLKGGAGAGRWKISGGARAPRKTPHPPCLSCRTPRKEGDGCGGVGAPRDLPSANPRQAIF